MVTSQRILSLLSLLESRSVWSGAELAPRLGVTERTLRRDIVRLRDLGYRIDSVQGVGGGYRLASGRVLPPLVLDEEEAIVVAACLEGSDGGTLLGQAARRALGKLRRMLPTALGAKVAAVNDAVQALPSNAPALDWNLLLTLAQAGRSHRLVRFGYRRRDGQEGERTVEPGRIVTAGGRWYLLAFDRGRGDWRTFRLDRMSEVSALTFGFQPRPMPDADQALRGDDGQRWRHYAAVRFGCDAGRLTPSIPASHCVVLASGVGEVTVRVGADDLDALAWHLYRVSHELDVGFDVVEWESLDPADLRSALRRWGERVAASLSPAGPDLGDVPALGPASAFGGQ